MSDNAELIDTLFSEWRSLHGGPARVYVLVRKPLWKAVFCVPWMWLTHFRVAARHTTKLRAARFATLFAWAYLTSLRGKAVQR